MLISWCYRRGKLRKPIDCSSNNEHFLPGFTEAQQRILGHPAQQQDFVPLLFSWELGISRVTETTSKPLRKLTNEHSSLFLYAYWLLSVQRGCKALQSRLKPKSVW